MKRREDHSYSFTYILFLNKLKTEIVKNVTSILNELSWYEAHLILML